MRRTVPANAQAQAAFESMNITPLIDVLLVLLVMFIMAVPAATHAVKVDLPQPGAEAPPPVVHQLMLTREGLVLLDGRMLNDAALARALPPIADTPGDLLAFRASPDVRYGRFDEVLAMVKRAGVTRLGFVGHERMVR